MSMRASFARPLRGDVSEKGGARKAQNLLADATGLDAFRTKVQAVAKANLSSGTYSAVLRWCLEQLQDAAVDIAATEDAITKESAVRWHALTEWCYDAMFSIPLHVLENEPVALVSRNVCHMFRRPMGSPARITVLGGAVFGDDGRTITHYPSSEQDTTWTVALEASRPPFVFPYAMGDGDVEWYDGEGAVDEYIPTTQEAGDDESSSCCAAEDAAHEAAARNIGEQLGHWAKFNRNLKAQLREASWRGWHKWPQDMFVSWVIRRGGVERAVEKRRIELSLNGEETWMPCGEDRLVAKDLSVDLVVKVPGPNALRYLLCSPVLAVKPPTSTELSAEKLITMRQTFTFVVDKAFLRVGRATEAPRSPPVA